MGPVKGTFVLTEATVTDTNGMAQPRQELPVMSTVIGLTAHMGQIVAVRGRLGEHKRNGRVLRVQSLIVVSVGCR